MPVRVPARAPHAALLDEAAPEAEPVPEPVRARPGERRLARAAAQRGVLALGAAAAARAHGRARARARDIPLGAVLARSSFALALAPAGAEAELAEDAARAVLSRIVALLDDVLEELVLAVVVLLVAEAELALEGVGALAARAELDALVPPDAQRARALVGRDEDARRRRRCGGGGGRARRRRRRGAGRPRRRRKDDALVRVVGDALPRRARRWRGRVLRLARHLAQRDGPQRLERPSERVPRGVLARSRSGRVGALEEDAACSVADNGAAECPSAADAEGERNGDAAARGDRVGESDVREEDEEGARGRGRVGRRGWERGGRGWVAWEGERVVGPGRRGRAAVRPKERFVACVRVVEAVRRGRRERNLGGWLRARVRGGREVDEEGLVHVLVVRVERELAEEGAASAPHEGAARPAQLVDAGRGRRLAAAGTGAREVEGHDTGAWCAAGVGGRGRAARGGAEGELEARGRRREEGRRDALWWCWWWLREWLCWPRSHWRELRHGGRSGRASANDEPTRSRRPASCIH